MKKIPHNVTVEKLYPLAKARAKAWTTVDAMPSTRSVIDHLDAFDQAYVDAGGVSPFRGQP